MFSHQLHTVELKVTKMEVVNRQITLPVWQHVSLVLIGSVSLANLVHLYTTRFRTRNVRQKKVFKTKYITPTDEKYVEEDESGDEGENESGEEEESEFEEVLMGEINNYEFPTEPFKQVLCVNTDLKKMDKGKAMAQCSHATLGAYRMAQRYAPANVRHWQMLGQTKIALKCTEAQMLEVAENAKKLGVISYTVEDAGRTQIPAGSKTVCALGPAPQSLIDQITGGFKLM